MPGHKSINKDENTLYCVLVGSTFSPVGISAVCSHPYTRK